jgi:hypothetical protein
MYIFRYSFSFAGGSHLLFCSLLEAADVLIIGDFALAMMEDEYWAQKWAFDTLSIIVRRKSVALLEDFFTRLDYQCKINEHDIYALPDALRDDVFNFMLGLTNPPPPTTPAGFGSIELIVCYGGDRMQHVVEALSTGLASFVTPSGIFCAFPRLTFNHQAMAMNHLPTTQMLQIHVLFGYELWLSNGFWSSPCGIHCPGRIRRLTASFAVIPLRETNDTTQLFGSNRWWRIKADCFNLNCPYYGSYMF